MSKVNIEVRNAQMQVVKATANYEPTDNTLPGSGRPYFFYPNTDLGLVDGAYLVTVTPNAYKATGKLVAADRTGSVLIQRFVMEDMGGGFTRKARKSVRKAVKVKAKPAKRVATKAKPARRKTVTRKRSR